MSKKAQISSFSLFFYAFCVKKTPQVNILHEKTNSIIKKERLSFSNDSLSLLMFFIFPHYSFQFKHNSTI